MELDNFEEVDILGEGTSGGGALSTSSKRSVTSGNKAGSSRATPPRQRIRKDVLPVINYPLSGDDKELCELASELLDDLPRLPVVKHPSLLATISCLFKEWVEGPSLNNTPATTTSTTTTTTTTTFNSAGSFSSGSGSTTSVHHTTTPTATTTTPATTLDKPSPDSPLLTGNEGSLVGGEATDSVPGLGPGPGASSSLPPSQVSSQADSSTLPVNNDSNSGGGGSASGPVSTTGGSVSGTVVGLYDNVDDYVNPNSAYPSGTQLTPSQIEQIDKLRYPATASANAALAAKEARDFALRAAAYFSTPGPPGAGAGTGTDSTKSSYLTTSPGGSVVNPSGSPLPKGT